MSAYQPLNLEISEDQLRKLILQLPREKRLQFLSEIRRSLDDEQELPLADGIERMRKVAATYDKNWDELTEEEREQFVADIVREGRESYEARGE